VSSTDLYRTLFRQMEWADAAVWTAVLASPAACSDERLRELLHHVHLVQRAFLRMWRGEAVDTQAGEGLDAPALAKWAREYYPEVHAELTKAGAEALDRVVEVPWTARAAARFGVEPRQPTAGETLLQVYAHTAHHRGQINLRLRELGGEPPLIDFIAWLWQGRPAAAWP
jgi:uncharacterized damage-inducible protein DinB